MGNYPPTVPQPQPRAIVYRNGCRLFLPEYNQAFVQRLKWLVPPTKRLFHGGHAASYTIIAPYSTKAIALAGEWWPTFTRIHTNEPYEFPGDDRMLLIRQRQERAARRLIADEVGR